LGAAARCLRMPCPSSLIQPTVCQPPATARFGGPWTLLNTVLPRGLKLAPESDKTGRFAKHQPADRRRVMGVEGKRGKTLEQFAERGARLQPGEVNPYTHMRPLGEGQIASA